MNCPLSLTTSTRHLCDPVPREGPEGEWTSDTGKQEKKVKNSEQGFGKDAISAITG